MNKEKIAELEKALNEKWSKKKKTPKVKKKYTMEHKELFMAIFGGTADIDSNGKVVVNGKEWDWADVDVQYFVQKSRQLKVDMTKFLEKELENIFGKL